MTERYEDLGGQQQKLSPEGQAFIDALAHHARASFHPNATAGGYLKAALKNGWTPEALAKECSRDLNTASNAGAIVNHRLQTCADITPTKGLPRFVQPKPWCGNCSDEHTRWLTDTELGERCTCWTDPRTA